MPTATRRLVPILLAGLVLFTLPGAVGATDVPPPFDQATLAQARTDVVTLINQQRLAAGRASLPADPTLMAVAQARADVMARTDIFSHTEPDGTTASSRVAAAGVTWSAIGEIIAWNNHITEPVSTQQAVMLWMVSPGHYDIMVSSIYNRFGVGAADSASGKHYYVAVFIRTGTTTATVTTTRPDTTRPWVRVFTPTRTIIDRYHARVRVSWTGGDYRVQGATTSGLRYYEVQRRIVGHSWVSLGTTTSTVKSFIATRRRTYEIRVRDRDRAGNWSSWRYVRILT